MTADLLIGCGGLYMFLFAALVVAAPQVHSAIPALLLPLAILVISIPHYGGTLLRVYQEREERRKYAVFTIYITIFLCGWFALGTYNYLIGSLMVTLYLTWSPWHYSGQNYGLLLMFLGRRGVTVTPLAKRALWASFMLSFLLTLLAAHGAREGAFLVEGPSYELVEFIPFGIPRAFSLIAAMIIFPLYLGALAIAGSQLLRTGRLRDLFPSAMLIVSQSLWFVVPTVAVHLSFVVEAQGAAAYSVQPILWMAAAHAAQYLWITSYYAKHSKNWPGRLGYYRNTMLAGSLVWVVPAVLFAPYALGGMPFATGMAMLLGSLVNLHHFVLDGAIWKLRNSRIGSILIQDKDDLGTSMGANSRTGRSWLKHVVWATAGVCTLSLFVNYYQETIVFEAALKNGELERARKTVDGLAWIGHDAPKRRMRLGDHFRDVGDLEAAIVQYRHVISQKTRVLPDSVAALAAIYMTSGRGTEARELYQQAIDGGWATDITYYNFGTTLATEGDVRGAIPFFRKAIELAPRLSKAHSQLATALVMTDQISAGIKHYRRALKIDPEDEMARQNLESAIQMRRESQRRK
jgi:Flp pilus assembly protein TadD